MIAFGLNCMIMLQFGLYWNTKPKRARLVKPAESKKTK